MTDRRRAYEFGIESRQDEPESALSRELDDFLLDPLDAGEGATTGETPTEPHPDGDGSPRLDERPASPPGPGLFEAVAWTTGILPVQLLASFVGSLIVMIYFLANGKSIEPDDLVSWQATIVLLGAAQMGMFVYSVGGVLLRLHPDHVVNRLGLTVIPWRHFGVIAVTMLPVTLLCGQVQVHVTPVWERIVEANPHLGFFDDLSTESTLEPLFAETPFGLMLFLIAVMPAVVEELIFRGLIGRGLVARWGPWIGVLITSVLFAVIHMHPVHAMALLPIAIFLHVSYLSTRSIFAPMLIHFVNNGLAVTVGKFLAVQGDSEVLAAQVLADESALAWPIVAGLACIMATAIVLLVKIRVQHRLPDGATWDPGYVTVESPPDSQGCETVRPRAPAWALILYIGAVGATIGLAGYEAFAV